MKIFLNKISEDWIIDRVSSEFKKNFKTLITRNIKKADVVWIIAPWTWRKISEKSLIGKKVLCSYYHFDFSKFDLDEFNYLDQFVDEYHVISKKTKEDLTKLTEKKITSIPFWVDENLFFNIKEKDSLRERYGFKKNEYLVGTFQRDTEGSDLSSPKLIKGPDILLNIVKEIFEENSNLKVVLSGKRRQYLINNFEKLGIPYKHFEMVDIKTLNELYNLLDIYIVSSRIEGGPQAIIECGLTKTPIISTNVGVASEILSPASIYKDSNFKDARPDINVAYQNSLNFTKENGLNKFFKMIELLYEN